MQHLTDPILVEANAKIASLLQSSNVSSWLKTALRAFDGFDAVMLQNDIEILRSIIAPIASSNCEIATRPLSLE